MRSSESKHTHRLFISAPKSISIPFFSILFFACAGGGPYHSPAHNVQMISNRIESIRIGMTKMDVHKFLGKPTRTQRMLTAGGEIEHWGYTVDGLGQNLLSEGEQFALGFTYGPSIDLNGLAALITFVNGQVTSVQK
jgi:hypothetical protein